MQDVLNFISANGFGCFLVVVLFGFGLATIVRQYIHSRYRLKVEEEKTKQLQLESDLQNK